MNPQLEVPEYRGVWRLLPDKVQAGELLNALTIYLRWNAPGDWHILCGRKNEEVTWQGLHMTGRMELALMELLFPGVQGGGPPDER